MTKTILRALAGETLPVPPVWMMRQAGRYLPEYRATRAEAGDFLSLCYAPDLAAEVTLQPIRRYGFDAAIHDTLSPIYETVRILARDLPKDTTLIGFAGAPWTVATYMVAGRGTPDQGPAHALKASDRATFQGLIDILTEGTIAYLSAQVEAGAEVIKLFDSWAGSLKGQDFDDFALAPARRIIGALKARHPGLPVIAFPREAGPRYEGFARATGADCVALDSSVSADWAAAHVQKDGCVQGNLDQRLLVTGGEELVAETKRVVRAFSGGPHIFNLGHGITPDADPDNVQRMIDAIRG